MTYLRAVRVLLACCAVLAQINVRAAEEEKVSLNFVNADIESVVKAVSQATGRSFLIDPRVKGTINLVSSQPVPRSLTFQILSSALRLQGFAVVESGGGVTKIIPEADARTHAGPVTGAKAMPQGEQLVTQVFQIRNESASQLVPVLRPLITTNNTITAYPNNNTLVITDYANNLKRIEKIIDTIDVPHGDDPEVIPVRHASALDLAAMLNRLFADQTQAGGVTEATQRVTIAVDGRTNSLIVRSDNQGKVVRVRNLVASLDQPSAAKGNIHVIYLKNADAVKVAQTLRAVVSGETGSASASATTGSLAPPQAAASSAATSPSMAPLASGAATSNQANLSSGSLIQADQATNALIITAPEPIYRNLRHVVDQLDKRRAQVHIEALVVELTAAKASEFGVQWQRLSGGTDARLLGGTNFATGGSNIVGVIENVAKAGATGSLGIAPGLNVGLVTGKANLAMLLRALETDNQANILSTPNIVTLDNEEARIVVGQNVPFVTGSYAQVGTTVSNPFQTFERRDVGLTLKVKPQITEGGVVRVQIYQEASALQANSVSNTSGPITNKRSLESTVLVDDGSIIALGGLIDDNFGTGEDKVPILGDVPLLGGLFRYETKKRTKTNLMVFLRPTVIRDSGGYQGFTADRYEMLIGAQKKFEEGRRSWPDSEISPQLPPLAAPGASPTK